MWLCDNDPPESSDQVLFFCEEQMNIECDESKDSNHKNNSKGSSVNHQSTINKSDNEEPKQKKTANIFNWKKNKKNTDNVSNRRDVATGPDEDNQTRKKSIGLGTDDDLDQTGHTILVKIQMENCSQCPDNSISIFSHETPNKNIEQCKLKKKTVAVQVNFNSVESVVESHCLKISNVRCCNKVTRTQNINNNKGKKCNGDSADDDSNSSESNQVHLLNGKNVNQSTNDDAENQEKPKFQGKSLSVDRPSIKSRKFSNAVSPLKKFNRSSLTITPDKVTINQSLHCYNGRPPFANNLSKYSPCASRLAASSKILGNTSPTAISPESPLHVARPKSPRATDSSMGNFLQPLSAEKATLQTSLSLNINPLKKSHSTTSRSRSVGDSCVTSPTSEATTLSYSPTGTEIVSLDEIGQQIPTSNSVSLSAPDLRALHNEKLTISINVQKANLETKC
ncbi:probable cyclin-dependent serine/threonine-protein kinase DDB_G0292550 [Chelonus insularis]|uniref:probable cyclin-dependent serine/threonine-protein kinase DDB_G0292550 n=1 Tax=Chelonus insularis TaxID=460826 RepID=UPI00158AAA11|nr:probable cyclin-dependent serine/threonine-protein kinase DDB_G0292550 [Chelonus insularis]